MNKLEDMTYNAWAADAAQRKAVMTDNNGRHIHIGLKKATMEAR
jgi:hypothetical protein